MGGFPEIEIIEAIKAAETAAAPPSEVQQQLPPPPFPPPPDAAQAQPDRQPNQESEAVRVAKVEEQDAQSREDQRRRERIVERREEDRKQEDHDLTQQRNRAEENSHEESRRQRILETDRQNQDRQNQDRGNRELQNQALEERLRNERDSAQREAQWQESVRAKDQANQRTAEQYAEQYKDSTQTAVDPPPLVWEEKQTSPTDDSTSEQKTSLLNKLTGRETSGDKGNNIPQKLETTASDTPRKSSDPPPLVWKEPRAKIDPMKTDRTQNQTKIDRTKTDQAKTSLKNDSAPSTEKLAEKPTQAKKVGPDRAPSEEKPATQKAEALKKENETLTSLYAAKPGSDEHTQLEKRYNEMRRNRLGQSVNEYVCQRDVRHEFEYETKRDNQNRITEVIVRSAWVYPGNPNDDRRYPLRDPAQVINWRNTEVGEKKDQKARSISKGTGDDAGHLMALQFGADPARMENIARQNWIQNQSKGTYYRFEQDLIEAIRKGDRIADEIGVKWKPEKSDRPIIYNRTYTQLDAEGKPVPGTGRTETFMNSTTQEVRAHEDGTYKTGDAKPMRADDARHQEEIARDQARSQEERKKEALPRSPLKSRKIWSEARKK